jgi:hypothetical protein
MVGQRYSTSKRLATEHSGAITGHSGHWSHTDYTQPIARVCILVEHSVFVSLLSHSPGKQLVE